MMLKSKWKKSDMTFDKASKLFRYDPKSGKIYWINDRGKKVKAGSEAGYNHTSLSSNYRVLRFSGSQYLAHRMAWLLSHGEWPDDEIDHIDGNGLNNAIINLRDVTRSINAKNTGMKKCNTSGVTGVYWRKDRSVWAAKIGGIHIGHFSILEDAKNSYNLAKENLNYTNRHGS